MEQTVTQRPDKGKKQHSDWKKIKSKTAADIKDLMPSVKKNLSYNSYMKKYNWREGNQIVHDS